MRVSKKPTTKSPAETNTQHPGVTTNSTFVDKIGASLIGCVCNADRLAIRNGFVDK